MGDQPLLSDLCKICTNDTPKYCCPRCNSRTCSLPCYKRHKTWSQCSGKRDPAAYVKINQLATPAGIDRDYNFLTGVERSFTAADHNVEERGISLDFDVFKAGPVEGSNLQKSLDASGVVIRRMPKGMSRQKSNRTQWHIKQRCISWTVEWIHPDHTRDQAQCRENLPLAEAYAQLLAEKHTTEKHPTEKQPKEKQPSKKRKRGAAPRGQGEAHAVAGAKEPANRKATPLIFPKGGATQTSGDSDTVVAALDMQAAPVSTSQYAPDSHSRPDDGGKDHIRSMLSQAKSAQSPAPNLAPSSSSPRHFYLHKDLTPTSVPVLIPLPATTVLSRALRGRTVIEYPAIYVLHEPPESLPPQYQLEEKLPRKILEIAEAGLKHLPGEAPDDEATDGAMAGDEDKLHASGVAEVEEVFQAAGVFELLQRDIEAVSKAI